MEVVVEGAGQKKSNKIFWTWFMWDGDQRQKATTSVQQACYGLMLRRSSSIRNAGGRSCWCRSRYSAISSSAFRVGSARALVKKRRHTEIPHLTASASRDKEEAGMALSR